ncbi:MAG: serine hydrolase [Ignavibacteriales bacterium]|nr:serine hydrolase [Ignavibacteriales bacterium]
MTRPAFLTILAAAFLSGCGGAVTTVSLPPPPKDTVLAPPPMRSTAWIDSTLRRMTLEEKAAQLVSVWAPGSYLAKDSKEWKTLLHLVRDLKIGGFVFSTGDVYEYAVQIDALQQASTLPLWIAGDFEYGTAMRVRRSTGFPRAMALGATRDAGLAYAAGKATAEESRSLGVYQNFAPVMDVNTNPRNPVINTRAFSDNPMLVAELGSAFIRGTQEAGVVATAKHFPGHGDSEIDTHLHLPTLSLTASRLDSVELLPFREAIRQGVQSIMVGHMSVPALDTANGIPATLSHSISTTLLVEKLGFNGLVVTDALEMGSIRDHYTPAEAPVLAIDAGADVVLMPVDADAAVKSIASALRKNEISMERVDRSVRKLLAEKYRAGLDTNRRVNLDAVASVVGSPEHQELAKRIALQAVTVLGNKSNLLPLGPHLKKKIVDIVFADTEDPSDGRFFHSQLKRHRRGAELLRIDTRSNDLDYETVLQQAKKADLVVCQLYHRVRSGQGTGTLPKKQLDLLTEIGVLGKPMLGISFGNPYVVMDMPPLAAYLCAYSDDDNMQSAAAAIVFGEESPHGKLPVTIPGFYNYGEGVEYPGKVLRTADPEDAGFDAAKLASVDTIINGAVRNKAFPGAVLLVAKDGMIVKNAGYGKFTYDADSTVVTPQTIFDMASCTKVIATTSAVMRLVDEKKISLSDPIVKYIPAFGQMGKENITIYNLMVHNSGLPGWRKFYEFVSDGKALFDSICTTPLEYRTGDTMIYSDLGLITIGKVIETVSGMPLDHYVKTKFFDPLGMTNTMYNPPTSLLSRIAPTEIDTQWKKTGLAVHGRVHDENAAVLGGVSGHAGLFSTASDLAILLQMELDGGTYNGTRYVQEATIREFTRRQSERSTRGIGWDTKNLRGSWAGKLISEKTFLHTGFTGTSVAVDPERKLIIILLTNRVYPTRENGKLGGVRPRVHDAVVGALEE